MESLQNELLHDAVQQLDPRSQFIIKSRWLDEHNLTLQDLAEHFEVSIQRISQIEKQAMKTIKEYMQNNA